MATIFLSNSPLIFGYGAGGYGDSVYGGGEPGGGSTAIGTITVTNYQIEEVIFAHNLLFEALVIEFEEV